MADPKYLGVFPIPPPIQASLIRPNLTNNPNYLIRFSCGNVKEGLWSTLGGMEVYANIPDQFRIGMQNQWENLFGRGDIAEAAKMGLERYGGRIGAIGSRVVGAISKIASGFGVTGITPVLTAQIWQGTNPLEFELQLQFETHDDPVKDCIMPVKRLMYMSSPYYMGPSENKLLTLLRAPGPSVWDLVKPAAIGGTEKNFTSVTIGRSVYLASVVITSLNINQASMFDRNGNPLMLAVDIGFKTFTVMTREELDAALWPTYPVYDPTNPGGP